MTLSELRDTRECYSDGFSLRNFTKRIDQLRESAKPFGATPGQSKKRKLLMTGNKMKSRKRLIDLYVNKKDFEPMDEEEKEEDKEDKEE
jgi:hypothetical protein